MLPCQLRLASNVFGKIAAYRKSEGPRSHQPPQIRFGLDGITIVADLARNTDIMESAIIMRVPLL
jgi:hypothetical protein